MQHEMDATAVSILLEEIRVAAMRAEFQRRLAVEHRVRKLVRGELHFDRNEIAGRRLQPEMSAQLRERKARRLSSLPAIKQEWKLR